MFPPPLAKQKACSSYLSYLSYLSYHSYLS